MVVANVVCMSRFLAVPLLLVLVAVGVAAPTVGADGLVPPVRSAALDAAVDAALDGLAWVPFDMHLHTDHSSDGGVFHQEFDTPESHDTFLDEQRDQALGTFVPTFDEEKKIVKIESVARGQQARSELAAMARLADEEQAKRYDVKKLKREGWAAASPVAIFPGFMSSSLEVKRCDRDKSWVGDRIWCDINKLGAARFIKKDGRLARKQVAEEVADEIIEGRMRSGA